MSARVRIDGLERAVRGLSPQQAARAIRGIQLGAAEEVRNAIAVYPEKSPDYPIRWASMRQKRWFWANVREGRIEIPYRRQYSPGSQRLGPSWTVASEGSEVFVGTKVTYAPYVQDADHQQPFHADTGWRTDRQAVDIILQSGVISTVVQDVLNKAFS